MQIFSAIAFILFAATMAIFVSWRICRGIIGLYRRKVLRWWETGYFIGWIAGGAFLALVTGVRLLVQVVGNPLAAQDYFGLMIAGYGVSVWVGGGFGWMAAAHHRITTRKRQPKVLGCGQHGGPLLLEQWERSPV